MIWYHQAPLDQRPHPGEVILGLVSVIKDIASVIHPESVVVVTVNLLNDDGTQETLH